MHVTAAETGILYSVLIRISQNLCRYSFGILEDVAGPMVKWAHQSSPSVPNFVHSSWKEKLSKRLKFWKCINNHGMENGLYMPFGS